MLAIARLGLMVFGFSIIFFLSGMVQKTHRHSEVVFLEHFSGFSFLIVTLLLFAWVISVHKFLKIDSIPFLKELLYVFTFVSLFTTIASFIGYC